MSGRTTSHDFSCVPMIRVVGIAIVVCIASNCSKSKTSEGEKTGRPERKHTQNQNQLKTPARDARGAKDAAPPLCPGMWKAAVSFAGPINVCAHARNKAHCRKQCNKTSIPSSETCVPASSKPFWKSTVFTIPSLPNCSKVVSVLVKVRADNHSDSCGQAKIVATVLDSANKSAGQALLPITKCKRTDEYKATLYAALKIGKGYSLHLSAQQAGDWILIVRDVAAEVRFQ